MTSRRDQVRQRVPRVMTMRHRRAFTLIECIAAMVILAVALPSMMFAIRQAGIDRVLPTNLSRARWLATEKLEDIIADRHSTTRGYVYLTTGNYPAENPIASNPDFSRSVSFTETDADLTTSGSGYMTVTVTVTWTDVTATARSFAVSTVLTSYGS